MMKKNRGLFAFIGLLLLLPNALHAYEVNWQKNVVADSLELSFYVSGQDAVAPDKAELIFQDAAGSAVASLEKPDVILDPDKRLGKCVLFLADTSLTMKKWLSPLGVDLMKAIIEPLPEAHKFSLAGFDSKLALLQNFTENKAEFISALSRLQAQGKFTEIFRLSYEALENLAACSGSRKILVIFSDGIAEDTNFTDRMVIDSALEKGIEIFAFGINKQVTRLQSLRILSNQTGGSFWTLQENTDLQKTASEFALKLETAGKVKTKIPEQATSFQLILSQGSRTLSDENISLDKAPPEQDRSLYYVAGVIAALLLTAGGFLLFKRRKGASEESEPVAYFCNEDGNFPVRKNRSRIGSLPDNDVVLNYPVISRYHALLEFKNDEFVLSDLNSKNGTYLNEEPERIKWTVVSPGDRVVFANVAFEFKLNVESEI